MSKGSDLSTYQDALLKVSQMLNMRMPEFAETAFGLSRWHQPNAQRSHYVASLLAFTSMRTAEHVIVSACSRLLVNPLHA